MRPSNKSRSRNKPTNSSQNQRRSVGNIINRVFDSAGPDGKVRGTPQQIIDKYNVLARDAQLSGDRVAAENYLQHAEHYSRLLGEAQRQIQEQRQAQEQRDSTRRDEGQRRASGQDADVADVSDDSGLATFDPRESEEASGPVETPESRSQSNREVAAPAEEAQERGGEPVARRSRIARRSETSSDDAAAAETTPAVEAAQDAAEEVAEKPAPKKRARRKPRTKATEETPEEMATGEAVPAETGPQANAGNGPDLAAPDGGAQPEQGALPLSDGNAGHQAAFPAAADQGAQPDLAASDERAAAEHH